MLLGHGEFKNSGVLNHIPGMGLFNFDDQQGKDICKNHALKIFNDPV